MVMEPEGFSVAVAVAGAVAEPLSASSSSSPPQATETGDLHR